jgi:class 3 adenylate cyclase
LDCAISIQKAFASFNCENVETPLHLRIGFRAGEPVEDDNDLFGATVQLAARLCSHDQILATKGVLEHYDGEISLFSNLGLVRPKGFDQAIPVYEVHWRGTD